MQTLKNLFKKFFIAGLLALVPIAGTYWVVSGLIAWLDSFFDIQHWFGIYIPGMGMIIAVVVILIVGAITRKMVGTWLAISLKKWISAIPVIGGLYSSLRQMMGTFLSSDGKKLGSAVLVEFPRKDSWTIGFLTVDDVASELKSVLPPKFVTVFVPTTPNPTSGFLLFVKRDEVKFLNMPVEQALKLSISLGIASSQEHGN